MPPSPGPPPPASGASSHDLLVVGSGVAGLFAAIAAAERGLRVLLITKDAPEDSSSDKAQGGVAVALGDEDEIELHHRDTIAAGDGLCDEEAVRVMVEEGPARIADLIAWGARFDRDGAGLALAQEGAHSARRVLHASGDSTGQEIIRALLDKVSSLHGISFLSRTYTVDLLVEAGRCAGLLLLDEPGGPTRIVRGEVLLAAGGCGQVYRETTNPPQATGDGIAMAYRAGALVRDMEFVQFHPTALALPQAPRFLLSEALRGEGGRLLDRNGHRFMQDVDPRAELAPRDVVARAITLEMTRTGASSVSLDLTHLDPGFVARRFPRIHRTCLGYGVDITKEPIPVSPSAHYMMGGVATDLAGRATLPGLYAAGEVACTGVHGANRLASNSLLEGLVFGARAGGAVVGDRRVVPTPYLPGKPIGIDDERVSRVRSAVRAGEAMRPERASALAREVREIAWSRAGILRDGEGLALGLRDLRALDEAPGGGAITRSGVEARNILLVASLIAASALLRTESRGAHYRSDHPARDDGRFLKSFLLGVEGGVREIPVRRGAA
jgi:L-aspartate oxidase